MVRKRRIVDVAKNYCGSSGIDAFDGALDSVWSSEVMKDINKRYGYVGYSKKWKRGKLSEQFAATNFCEKNELVINAPQLKHSVEYPSELVEYMKQVACIIRDDPSVSDDLQRKCLEECQGFEISLCKYSTPCFLIDEIFNGCRDAARQWMFKIMQSEKISLQLLCTPCSCHTLETLLSSLSNVLDIEVIDHWVDIILENWNQLISDKSATHFIRTLVYHLVGSRRKRSEEMKQCLTKDVSCKKMEINQTSKEIFGRIANMALDYTSMSTTLDNESVSMVLQDVVECDAVFQTGRLRKFVETACTYPDSVLKQWEGKQASHLWNLIVQKADEDLRQNLYHSVLKGKLFDLSLHMFATFPVQKFMLSATSNKLIVNVFDELMGHFMDICAESKWRVIIALVQMARNRDEVFVVKKIRNYFRCHSRSTKSAFVPCVFTLTCRTSAQFMETFDIIKGQLQGSLILQELVNYKHNKTMITSMKSLSSATILQMAKDKKGSFLLQALFKSSTVSRGDKELIAKPLKLKWHEVITNNISNHVFHVLWTNGLYNVTEKEELMDALSKAVIENHCRTLRLTSVKLNLRKFREQRSKWLRDAKTSLVK